MKHQVNRKHHAVRKLILRSGNFDEVRSSWINESLPTFPERRIPHRRTNRVRGNVTVQRRGTFYVASLATRDGVVRGIDNEVYSAIRRAKKLANGIQGDQHVG